MDCRMAPLLRLHISDQTCGVVSVSILCDFPGGISLRTSKSPTVEKPDGQIGGNRCHTIRRVHCVV